jgi:DNA-binding transcriptional LysR family regulator
MAVQLKGLKVFCDVVRQRSFSRAADENEISQSGASQLVQQLEEGLGVKLIDRSKRPFVLTPEGEVYYEGCREVVDRYFAVEDRVRRLHEEVAGRVRVASIYSVGLHNMNHCLQQFLSQHPKANVRLEYLHPDRVHQAVEDDVADLGLVSYPKSSRTIEALDWREEPMVLACAPTHPLAGRCSVSLRELDGMKMIGFDSNLTIRREIDHALELQGARVDVVMEFDNIETIKRAIEIDAGLGLLPEPTVVREVAAGTLVAVPLANEELVRPLGIIHRRGKELSTAAMRFIDLLRRQARTTTLESATHHVQSGGNGIPAEGIPVGSINSSNTNGGSLHGGNGHGSHHIGTNHVGGQPAGGGRSENGHASNHRASGTTSVEADERPELVSGNRRR